MSSKTALLRIRRFCVFAAIVAISITTFSRIGAGQTQDPGERRQTSSDSVSAAGSPKASQGNDRNKSALLSTLWSGYIWQSIPASDLKGFTPSTVSKAYQGNNWQPFFIDSRFGLDQKAVRLISRLRALNKDAIDPGPFKLDELSQSIDKLDLCRSALKDSDPGFEVSRAESFFNEKRPATSADQSPGRAQGANLAATVKNYRQCFLAASETDVLLTTDFFLFVKAMDPFSPIEEDLKALSGETPISKFLRELEPETFGYEALRAAYEKYKDLAAGGDHVYVSLPSTVHPGDRGNYIRTLQKRLQQEGFYSGDITGVYDRATQHAVKEFQSAHLLHPDGVVGRQTLAWLNVSFRDKANLIAYSLNAVRQSPSREFSRFIRINIPQFMLGYYKNGQLQQADKVVVGMATGKKVKRRGKIVGENQTPTLTSRIEQIIFNPRWYVDGRIRLELNAEAKSNPEWFSEHGYVKMQSLYPWGAHRLFQKSGPKNALGRVKFDFPNPYTVYLHDTPQKYLFAKTHRDFSHGCIRVDNALELAETLLEDDDNPYVKKMKSVLDGTRQVFVKLSQPVPISVEYIPVVADGSGQIIFAGDPYGVLSEENQTAGRLETRISR